MRSTIPAALALAILIDIGVAANPAVTPGWSAAAPPGWTPRLQQNKIILEDDFAPNDSAAAAEPANLRGCGACQFGDIIEGEPTCADTYEDAFNGGCNFTPLSYSDIHCGETVCGTYGTYLSTGGSQYRDTDWYHFTISETSDVTWTVVGDAATLIYIFDDDCPPSVLAVANAAACQPATGTVTDLAPGTYVAYVSPADFSGVPCGTRYRGTLTTSTCCTVEPQPGDLIEAEPVCADEYDDNFNGGCNSTPNVFSAIDCGETVYGTYGTYVRDAINYRDTDWYRFTLPATGTVTWTVVGEAPTRVYILDDTCPVVSLGTATAAACEPATITINNLAAGTYAAFVSPDVFAGVGCGAHYAATLTLSTCGVPGDANCDGTVDFFDIDAFVAALVGESSWQSYLDAAGYSATCDYTTANDCNGDGAVNFFDIDAFVTILVGGK